MSAYLQRLLARVAPPAAGVAALPISAGLPASPLFDGDQRIGMPGFSLLDLPGEGSAETLEQSANETDAGPRKFEPAPRAVPHASPQAEAAPVVSFAFGPEPDAARAETPIVPQAPVAPAATPNERTSGQVPRPSAPQVAKPVPTASNDFVLDVAPGDFEPAGHDPALLPAPASEARPAERHAASEPALEPAAPPVQAIPAPIRVEATPQPTPLVGLAPLPEPAAPREARPALDHPATLSEIDPPRTPDRTAEQSQRPVVIEQVVIDITEPHRPGPQQAEARSDSRGAASPAPLTADAASIIGPLPQSRQFASLFGMRRR